MIEDAREDASNRRPRWFADEWLTPQDVAAALDVSEHTLRQWHVRRVGPPRTKRGRTVLYSRERLKQWLAEGEVRPVRSECEYGVSWKSQHNPARNTARSSGSKINGTN